MFGHRVNSAKKLNCQRTASSHTSFLKPIKIKPIFHKFHRPVQGQKTRFKNTITPLLLFLTLFFSLYIAVLVGARIAYFLPF